MFGQSGNTSFSSFNTAAQSSPFGQSAFGKPNTTTSFGSGTTPVFGSSNTSPFSSKPTGSTTGGLFGNTTTPPAFRQPTITQPSFGGFGTTNTNTSLFGTQQNASTNLFGTNTGASAFGQSSNPGVFTFGSASGTNLFGQPQATQQTTPFAQSNATGNTNLFGTTPGFGSTNTTSGVTGTVVKFTPVITTDSMCKNGISHSISARHCCIASMKEYESKSYEELRFEDYSVGRKGPSTGLFGTNTPITPFCSAASGTNTAATGFGTPMTGGFGTTSQAGSGVFFGKTMSTFGTPATTTTNSFAFNSASNTNLFGTNTQAKPFSTTTTPFFPTSNTNQTAGTGFGTIGTNNTQQNSGFGFIFGSNQPNQSIGLLNQNKPAFNVSTSSGTGFTGFGTPTNTGAPLFNAKTTGTTGFGTTSTFASSTVPSFGPSTGFSTGQNTTTPLFNTSFKPAGQTPSFSFGPTPASTTGLGTNTGLTLNSGCSLFGQQKPGGLFSNTGGSTTFNTTGSFGSPAFGVNSNTNTGMGTGLMNNGTANNQMKNSGSMAVHQQILALVSAPFGDSPLLKNLLPASGKTEELLKPANTASKLLNGPQYKVSANGKSPKLKARVVTAAQLSKKSLFEGLEEEDPVLSEAFQPRPNAKRLVLRPKSNGNGPQSPNDNSHALAKTHGKEERVDVGDVYENDAKTTDKENQGQENNRQLANDRRSSISWLKSSIPRKSSVNQHQEMNGDIRADNEDGKEDSFAEQRSPFTFECAAEDGINNTVTELRPHANKVNQIYNDGAANSVNTTLNSSMNDKSNPDITVSHNDSSQDLDDSAFLATRPSTEASNPAKVILRRAGYYTIPSLDKLGGYVCGQTCVVPNFTVGREGYGNVYFADSFDVYGLNLDEIVHFRHKEVIIYPDDEKKPPVGQGLNRPAQVTLDKVWPHDKTLHEPITDPHRLAATNYEGKLRRVCAKYGTRFREYRPETGSWVFKVDHFSKYGLSDSDDEDESNGAVPANELKKLKAALPPGPDQKTTSLRITGVKARLNASGVLTTNETANDPKKIQMNGYPTEEAFLSAAMISRSIVAADDYNGNEAHLQPVSPTSESARLLGTDSHKLQLMKASFFDTNEDEFDLEPPHSVSRYPTGDKSALLYLTDTSVERNRLAGGYTQNRFQSSLPTHRGPVAAILEEEPITKLIKPEIKPKKLRDSGLSIHRPIPDPRVVPVTAIVRSHSEVIPLKDSVLDELQYRCIADTGIQMGRMFRPSWGRGLTLLSLSTQERANKVPLQAGFDQLGYYISGRQPDDLSSTSIVQRLQIFGSSGAEKDRIQAFKESIEGHLRIKLSNCLIRQDGECPIIGVDTETADHALQSHSTLAQELAEQPSADRFSVYVANVWKLCVALWGNLPESPLSKGHTEHHNVVARREAIGDWLKEVVHETVEREIADLSNQEKIILQLLTAFKLEQACEAARRSGDHCLALLMAQLRSGMPVRDLIKQQLALWQEMDVDENLSLERLKLFTLAAGEPLISSKHGTVNICEGLDWKRALAMHLWYLCSPTASIRDALELYEGSFDTKETDVYAAAPVPEYMESDLELEMINGTRPIYDLCYHLLKLYCTGDHELGALLNPSTHTTDPLDYRLSWLIQQLLLSLGYAHLPEHVAALTHTNFATQLEAYGLWHWAIFVLLHLQDPGIRRLAVTEMLHRHVEVEVKDASGYAEREQFLRQELGIPSGWIDRAKAVKSNVMKRYGEAACYYIQAKEWNAAHEIIIEHLAADAIINENYGYLKELLGPLVPRDCSETISGWPHQGQLLWDYMEITGEIEKVLSETDFCNVGYKLELLKPRLTCLCLKINQFPCLTAKHRLCQAEIAKRTLHLARSLVMIQTENRSTAKILMNLVTQLPLPEDYAQQELRPIVNMRISEVVSQTA